MKKKINKCLDCGKEVSRRAKRCGSCAIKELFKNPKNNPNYIDGRCNKKCFCEICKKEMNNLHFIYRGTHICRDCKLLKKKSTYGYILIRVNNHPFANKEGFILEHRLVMEKYLGRYLTKKEVIHHINGIRDDNRIENLMLFSNLSNHRKFHALLYNFIASNYLSIIQTYIKQLKDNEK